MRFLLGPPQANRLISALSAVARHYALDLVGALVDLGGLELRRF
jgi:hypothetical protein